MFCLKFNFEPLIGENVETRKRVIFHEIHLTDVLHIYSVIKLTRKARKIKIRNSETSL